LDAIDANEDQVGISLVDRTPLFDSYNAAYVQALFDQFLQNPGSVDDAWRRVFETGAAAVGGLLGADAANAAVPGPPTEAQLVAARAAGELVDAYRLHGHRAAHVDPLGSPPPGHPQLEPEFHEITEAELATVPASMVHLGQDFDTIADVVEWLRETYTGPIGYEFEYLEDPEQREWLREQIESGSHRQPLSAAEQKRLLARLTEVETFEQFIHRAYLGAKRFSIEGTDMMVPMLDLAIERAAANGAAEIMVGMAHRGRLNVLAHVLGVPYADLVEKFEGKHALVGGTGDVKYHLGAEGTYATTSGEPLTVRLAPNPSHLEFVNPVVEGMTRARQTNRRIRELTRDENLVVPVLIHGDAAFSGQGVVAETLNLAKLRGYRTGGTLHIIANNQVGFTTDPRDARSTDYASDLARGFDVPVFHVNADDPEACLAVVRLAMAFRERFHGDVVIDLIGYRRYGHNEADEPAYTQPVIYARIAQHPTVRQIWADRLRERGVIGEEEAAALREARHELLVGAQEEARTREHPNGEHVHAQEESARADEPDTTVAEETLRSIDAQIHAWPEDFRLNPKLARQLEKRSRVVAEDGPIDWAHAEALAFGSLLAGGISLRMTGQDTERGTFSQRHLVLHDVETNRTHVPLANLEESAVAFEIYNSPLSELAAIGFEYGYSVVAPTALVLWEAQFGDFVNGAQVMIDQFLTAGREKWDQLSRMVLLLPHGYEGQGPEHSSARLERFLQAGAEGNIRVANCTTPAQYFHLLRRQALLPPRPLIVMTPKSLLRHPRATSRLADLATGAFHRILDDPAADSLDEPRRLVLCSGKVFYDLIAAREQQERSDVAIVRIEQLYPLPQDLIADALAPYAGVEEIVWVQEEPRNMGAWTHIAGCLRPVLDGRELGYIGRPERASPAEGYATDHEAEQQRIAAAALAGPRRTRRTTGRRKSRQSGD
jgi:2-oxoglutarate dehydrogenase E1 component